MASGLALRNLLHRTKTTAIIGAFQGVTRPENLRMANLLDISVEPVTAESLTHFDRIATVDVQPPLLRRSAHARRPGGRPPSGTDGIHDNVQRHSGRLRIDVDDLDRASAGRRCQTSRNAPRRQCCMRSSRTRSSSVGRRIEWISRPLRSSTRWADAALVRKMEGAEITLERLAYVTRAGQVGQTREQVFTAHLGAVPREDLIPYVADFLLQLGGRQVGDRVGCGERRRDRLGPQPGLLAQRRRLCQGVVRGHRQRRWAPGNGQGGRATCGVSQEIRQPGRRAHLAPAQRSRGSVPHGSLGR